MSVIKEERDGSQDSIDDKMDDMGIVIPKKAIYKLP
jgi:hypothetical protein